MSNLQREEWKPLDVEIARKVWDSLTPHAKQVYGLLFDSEAAMTAEEMASRLDTGVTQVLGAFGAPALLCKSHNRQAIQRRGPNGVWFVPPEIKELFRYAASHDPARVTVEKESDNKPGVMLDRCPYCNQPWKNASFPVGWDGHAEYVCSSVAHLPQEERKPTFKRMMKADGYC